MYKKSDYIKRGCTLVRNVCFPSHKKISTLMLYTTDLCDSRCKHCHIWAKRPVVHMSLDKIKEIMSAKCISQDTVVGLEGGEFLLHPQANEILDWFSKNHPKYDLLSNGLQPDRTIDAVKKYKPHRLYVSLDGNKETYKEMRGRDGYEKVMKVLEACKDYVPTSAMFTLSPFNSFKDMEHVIKHCQEIGVDVRVGVYSDIAFFDTDVKAHATDIGALKDEEEKEILDLKRADFKESIPDCIHTTSENYDFVLLYDEWRKQHLNLRCQSIRDSFVIHPDGNVPICQNLDLSLGNVYKNTLDEIINAASTRKVLLEHSTCNQCWINFHRKYDVVLLRNMERFIPKKMIELFYGKYQWCEDKKMTYASYLKKYSK